MARKRENKLGKELKYLVRSKSHYLTGEHLVVVDHFNKCTPQLYTTFGMPISPLVQVNITLLRFLERVI